MEKLKGTGVAVVTPFDANQAIDFPALERVVEHLIAGGVEYLVALGTTGEAVTLNEEEAFQVLKTISRVNDGRLPLVVGVGGNNTAKVCRRAKNVLAHFPVAAILSVSPYYNKPSQEGIYQHYRALHDAIETPIILYNVPGRTASNIEAETVLRLARDCERIIAVKEASGDLEQGMEIVAGKPEGFQVLSGDDLLAFPQLCLGFDGVISVAANAYPREFSDMIRLALAGKVAEGRALQYHLLRRMQLNFEEGNPAGVKAALHAQGICGLEVRLPLIPASDSLLEAIRKEQQIKMRMG
jgi:4-hydroxy-tetrahydrodipicolinate synthase